MASVKSERTFQKIRQRIDKLGIPNSKVEKLRSIKRLTACNQAYGNHVVVTSPWSNLILAFVLGALSIIFGSALFLRLYTSEGFSRLWFYVEGIDLDAESCTVDMPILIHDAFRPPVNCSMCWHVTQVEYVSELSPKEFEEKYDFP